jgi:Acyl CoA binding protein
MFENEWNPGLWPIALVALGLGIFLDRNKSTYDRFQASNKRRALNKRFAPETKGQAASARPWLVDSLGLDERFHIATQSAAAVALRVPRSFVVKLYGFFKQQRSGDCNVAAPSRLNLVEHAKWTA